MKNKTLYTAKDFEAYYLGTMPKNDMHALEKAALADPFLADALEGYEYTSTAILDTDNLIFKLKQKTKKTNRFSLLTHTIVFKVAASVTLVIGLGYLFFKLNTNKNLTQVAKNETKNTIQKLESTVAIIDTIPKPTTLNNAGATINPNKLTSKEVIIQLRPLKEETNLSNTKKIIAEPSVTKTNAAPIMPDNDVAINDDNSPKMLHNFKQDSANAVIGKVDDEGIAKKEQAQNTDKFFSTKNSYNNNLSNSYNYNGIVQSPTGGPMQNATLRLRNNIAVAQTDLNGRFSFKAIDSVTNVTVAATGFQSVDVTLNANTNTVPISLQNDNSELSEVVVVGSKPNKNFKKTTAGAPTITKVEQAKIKAQVYISKDLAGKAKGLQIEAKQNDVEDIKQQLALTNFDAYVSKNIKPIFDVNGNQIKGTVILSFYVNKKSKVQNIVVVKKLYVNADKHAIQLLKNGPKWPFSKNIIQLVSIAF